MPCPPPIAEILINILRIGLLRIRAKGWEEEAEACALEADHLHNLPDLLVNFSIERLQYYWEAERVGFIEHAAADELKEFEPWWNRLADHIPGAKREMLARE